jgi:hypothetical protein
MKKRGRWFVPMVLILMTAAWILSCGGGGDGDSSSGPAPATGPTNTIDTATIDEIMKQVDDLGIGCTTDGSAARYSTVSDTLETLLRETADSIAEDYRARQAGDISAASADESIVLPSDCPGSTGEMRIDITYDDVTFAFSGTLAFTDFCIVVDEISDEVDVAGGATFSGQLGFDSSDELNSISLSASTTTPIVATATDFSASVSVTGLSFSFNEQPDGSGAVSLCWTSLDVDVTDGADSESVDTDNVCINVSVSSAGAITVTLSATVTTADGSLDISTPTSITIDSSGNITGGVLQIDGANNTAVQITYAGSGYAFNVQADTDGDGEYDDYDQEMDCTELGSDLGDMF